MLSGCWLSGPYATALECEGTRDGKVCASKAPGSLPPFGGL